MKETWTNIRGYRGAFQVSTNGNVRKVKKAKDGSVTTKPINHLYDAPPTPRVRLCYKGKRKYHTVSNLVLQTFKGKAPKNGRAIALNGDRGDVRLKNLSWVKMEKEPQFSDRGDLPRFLYPEEVQAIRDMYATGEYSQRDLGNLFKVSQVTIHRVVTFKSHNYVKGGTR